MIRPEVFARYAAANVPRYTSYPTAPNFQPTGDDAVHREWLEAIPAKPPVSLYLHVPFCRHMCWYCGCHTTVASRQAPMLRYARQLAREIRLVAGKLPERLTIGHMHWGGGTPTLLPPAEIRSLDRQIRRAFDISPMAEIGLEIDPRTLDRQVAEGFADAGVNRASIGVQTFDPMVQQRINRIQSEEQVVAAVRLLRSLGVNAINFDLIYGLPLQTTASCLETVERVVELQPDRIAVFGYAHVPSFKPHQRKIKDGDLPGSGARTEQAAAISETLIRSGYEAIGLDHFALPGDPLAKAVRNGDLHRNFQGYTTDACETLIGLGASAISRLPGGFVQNAVRIPDYYTFISEGRLPSARACAVSAEDARRARIIEQLMCNYRAEVALSDTANLQEFEREGLVRRSGSMVEITEPARPLVRTIAAAFDEYLPVPGRQHSPAL